MIAELGDIAIVTTKSGYKFVGEFKDCSIDCIWVPIIRDDKRANNQLRDPDVSWEIVGRIN